MALAVDDLKSGMFVAIVEILDEPAGLYPVFGRRVTQFDGQPLRIIEVSLPFVAVTDGQKVGFIDARAVRVCRVSRRYWNVAQAAGVHAEPPKPRRRKKKTPELGHCPHCGEKLSQKLMPDRKWYFWCRWCQELGEPA